MRAPDTDRALRTAADALACDALGAVVLEVWGDVRQLDLVASRKLTLAAQASVKGTLATTTAHLGILLSVIVLAFLVYLCYAYAPAITRHISPQTAHGILRVIAFVLLCIGVQITWNGVQTMLKTVVNG